MHAANRRGEQGESRIGKINGCAPLLPVLGLKERGEREREREVEVNQKPSFLSERLQGLSLLEAILSGAGDRGMGVIIPVEQRSRFPGMAVSSCSMVWSKWVLLVQKKCVPLSHAEPLKLGLILSPCSQPLPRHRRDPDRLNSLVVRC